MSEVTRKEWSDFLEKSPQAHLLQTPEWGQLKSEFGWRSRQFIVGDTGAQVLFKPIKFGLNLAYIPKGPIGSDWISLWEELDYICKQEKAVFLKVEPDIWEEKSDSLINQLPDFIPSKHAIQPRQTITISLKGTEEDWLMRMKQKARYNIRLAERKKVIIQKSTKVNIFNDLMEKTSDRNDFGVHSKSYYDRALDIFKEKESAVLFLAYYEDIPLAGIIVFKRGKRAWYFYGASNNFERNRMPTYLIQFEAMKWAFEHGCIEYDLWGIPDASEEILERDFTKRNDGLWGVYRFKRGFGGDILRTVGAFDRVYKKLPYFAYLTYIQNRI